jgi:hypothetical protein
LQGGIPFSNLNLHKSGSGSVHFISAGGGMKMQQKLLLGISLAVFCVLAFSVTAVAAEFSADLIMQHKGEKERVGKYYVKGEKRRQEMSPDGQGNQIMIFRPDKKLVWILMPEEKMYMVNSYKESKEEMEPMAWTPAKQGKAKYLGKEKVSGFTCKKYEITDEGNKAHVWVSEALGSMLKMEHKDGLMQYKNIKKESLSDALFEIPSGYQKMGFPMMPAKARRAPEKEKTAGKQEDESSMGAAKSLLKSLGW